MSAQGQATADRIRDKACALGIAIEGLEADDRDADLRRVMIGVGLPVHAIDGVRLVLALRAAQLAEMS